MAEDWQIVTEKLSGRLDNVEGIVETHAKQDEILWNEQRKTNDKVEAKLDRPSRFDSMAQSILLALLVGVTTYLVTH